MSMVYGRIEDIASNCYLPEVVKSCFKYVTERNLLEMANGRYEIDGQDLYVDVVQYRTSTILERNWLWEAHRSYVDIHVMLQGREQVDLNFLKNMRVEGYLVQDDFVLMEGEPQASVVLKPADFLICCPDDAHRTAIALAEPEVVKKAIFKARLKQ